MAKVRGEDAFLKMSNGSDEVPIICARSFTLDIKQDMIETSIKGSNQFRTYVGSAISWSGSLEGFTYLERSNIIRMGIGELIDKLLQGIKFTLYWYESDIGNAHFSSKTGDVYIESISEVASFDNLVTFSINFIGTGRIENNYG